MTLKKLVNADAGDADHWGGNDQDTFTTAIDYGEDYSYLMTKSGSNYYAKTSAGEVYNTNTDFGVLFNSLTTLAAGNRCLISLQPSQTFTTSTPIVMKTNVFLDGNYAEIKLANGVNNDVIVGENFATLTGTNAFSTNVPHDFTIRYLRIDGNKANNTSAGYGIRVVAWGYDFDHVFVYNTKQDGIYSEWGTTTGCPLTADLTKRCMEAYWDNVYVHDCGGRGITWRGPHDSVLSNVFSWGNDAECVLFQTLASTYSGGCTCSNWHMWGGTNNAAPYTIVDNTSVLMSNFISEGADGVGGIGIHVKAGTKLWGDCEVFANETGIKFDVTANYSNLRINSFSNTHGVELLGNQNHLQGYLHDNTTTDIKIGSAGTAVSYCMINMKMTRTPLAIDWLNTGNTDNMIIAQIETSAGHVALTGTPNFTNNDLLISSKGAGTNYTSAQPLNATSGAALALANTFTEAQKITKDAANLLTIYRTNTGTNGVGIAFNKRNASSTEKTIGIQYAITKVATAGAEDGRFAFYLMKAGAAAAEKFGIEETGTLTLVDAANIVAGSTTGTKIGTATTQKLGFYNVTPIVQPAANADTSGATLAALETEVNEVKATLRALGLMA